MIEIQYTNDAQGLAVLKDGKVIATYMVDCADITTAYNFVVDVLVGVGENDIETTNSDK